MSENDAVLSEATKARIERNHQKALSLRQSRLVSHPYSKGETISIDVNTLKIGTKKYTDTGGGFLKEEEENTPSTDQEPAVQDDPPIHEEDRPFCNKCDKPFAVSWLFDKFGFKCCDICKDDEDEHKLISKTDAMNKYLLKPVDIDKREPILKFINRVNPHNARWSSMKLYLQAQVEERALEVWGSKEKIEEAKKLRDESRTIQKAKKYDKELKALKMSVRSSLYDRTTKSHTHKFGAETYNEADDTYTRKCSTCSYSETFEKM